MHFDRRNGKRYDSRFGVVFSDSAGLNFSFITNLSRSGAYLHSKRIFRVGSHMSMKISNGNFDVPIQGKIVRVDRTMRDGEQFGMAVAFDFLSPAAKRLRDDLLLYLMNLKYHRQWQ